MCTVHKTYIGDAKAMNRTKSDSVEIVVTSPPYPMIEMWDECFAAQDPQIGDSIESDPDKAFELMHQQMDEVWKECYRVLKDGGFMCINIVDTPS